MKNFALGMLGLGLLAALAYVGILDFAVRFLTGRL